MKTPKSLLPVVLAVLVSGCSLSNTNPNNATGNTNPTTTGSSTGGETSNIPTETQMNNTGTVGNTGTVSNTGSAGSGISATATGAGDTETQALMKDLDSIFKDIEGSK